jgi:hypothetical protein
MLWGGAAHARRMISCALVEAAGRDATKVAVPGALLPGIGRAKSAA